MTRKIRLAIFASGNGSNAEAIMRHFGDHARIEVALVASNNPDAGVLARAKNLNVPSWVFSKPEFAAANGVLQRLQAERIDIIVLAGFLWLMPPVILDAFGGRIVNVHPSLLPKFGGKGMYGMNVHRAVKAAGETETGITIHEVNARYDEGAILFQASCPIFAADTPEQIQANVNQLEHRHYPTVIEHWALSLSSSFA